MFFKEKGRAPVKADTRQCFYFIKAFAFSDFGSLQYFLTFNLYLRFICRVSLQYARLH